MKLVVEQGDLLRALEHTLGVVDKKGHMPILAHCLMEASNQGAVISATDLEIYFRGAFPAEVVEPGALAVPAHTLHRLVKSLPKTDLQVTWKDSQGSQMKLTSGESHYKFNVLHADEFPGIPKAGAEDLTEVDARPIIETLRKTAFSIGDDLQYPLQAVLWEKVESEAGFLLRMVSSDGHRISLAERPMPGVEQLELGSGILVPAKALPIIRDFLIKHAPDGHVQMGIIRDFKILFFRAGEQELAVRLLDKRFPDYRRIIPDGFENSFAFDRKALYSVVRRLSLLSQERFQRIQFALSNGKAEVTHENPDVGTGREVVELIKVEDISRHSQEPVTIGFNARYLLEPLALMEGETVLLETISTERPARLKDPADSGALYIIMPMEP